MYVSRKEFPNSVDLLYWNSHYALISSFDRFVADITKSKVRKFICRRCFGHFVSEHAFQTHQLFCSRPNIVRSVYTLPPPDTKVQFKNIRYQQRVPFVIYADSECLCTPFDKTIKKTHQYSQHVACSMGYKLVSDVPELAQEPYQSHTGPDVIDWFMTQMRDLERRCIELLFDPQRLILTVADIRAFNAATHCYICSRPCKVGDKVHDHDHLTGRYRGAAHKECNRRLQTTYKIPVFFHNFRGYDSHLVVWGMRNFPQVEISLIGQGMEKYLTVGWGEHLVFKDSYQFLPNPLDTLASNLLRSGKEKFKQLTSAFTRDNVLHPSFDLLMRKGVFPYDYLDSWEKLDEQALPPQPAFFSKLRQTGISDADYAHACSVWERFGCRSMREYNELYMKSDVLLLADIFEEFREVCVRNYGLDPAHYVSAPQLSWDSMLKLTSCSLDLISDPEMFRFIDRGIRGGVSNIVCRFARANNPYMSTFDAALPTSYIIDLDANNLYGWAMSQPMPAGGFQWMMPEEYAQIDWRAQTEEQPQGYFIECDLEYPPELHDAHNDYPLAPERLNVQATLLSDAQVELRTHYHISESSYNPKLVPNLMPKKGYLCHYLNLQFYLTHGMQLSRVTRVLKFRQSKWLAPYIAKNSTLRAAAKNDFEKEFFKLMNNSIYGKTCENQKKRTDIKLVTSEAKFKKLSEKPHLKTTAIFGDSLVGMEMLKLKSLINKPFYVGFSVLELSKLHMYRF